MNKKNDDENINHNASTKSKATAYLCHMKDTLRANQQLQHAIQNELRYIEYQKMMNRQEKLLILTQHVQEQLVLLDHPDQQQKQQQKQPRNNNDEANNVPSESHRQGSSLPARPSSATDSEDSSSSNKDSNEIISINENDGANTLPLSPKISRILKIVKEEQKQNPYDTRKWKRKFFSDPIKNHPRRPRRRSINKNRKKVDNLIDEDDDEEDYNDEQHTTKPYHVEPEPNDDTKRRRQYENARPNAFYHLHPPWSKKETSVLLQIMKEFPPEQPKQSETNKQSKIQGKESETLGSIGNDDVIIANACSYEDPNLPHADLHNECDDEYDDHYYTKVSQLLYEKMKKKKDASTTVSATALPRTAKECYVRIQELQHEAIYQKHPFTKRECQIILDMIHHHESSQTHDNDDKMNSISKSSSVSSSRIDWIDIANEVSKESYRDKKIYRTAWDCIRCYHQHIIKNEKMAQRKNQQPTPSSVWTKQEDEILLKYIAIQGPQYVLDYKSIHDVVTNLLPDKTKRQILFRANQTLLNPHLIPSSWTNDEERKLVILMKIYANVPKQPYGDIYYASTHFPNRSSKSVVDKWNRTMNPIYDTTSFTKQEDDTIIKAIHDNDYTIGWTRLSKQYLPKRHPHRIMSRWSEIASDHDILLRNNKMRLLSSSSNTIDTSASVPEHAKARQKRSTKQQQQQGQDNNEEQHHQQTTSQSRKSNRKRKLSMSSQATS